MDSPVVERRSRRIATEETVTAIITEDPLNDDEEEKRQRLEVENALQRKSISDPKGSSLERSMSEHVQSCIRLAAENKITAKNAFNFKLIDLLHVMLTKKKSIKDFTEVSHTLDAGVKIYSCRVDHIHADTLKMATSIHSNPNEVASDDEHITEAEAGNATEKKKNPRRPLKSRHTTVDFNAEQINRKKPTEQENIVHKVLSLEEFITDSAIFDSKTVSWHLDASLNFWKSNEQTPLFNKEKISIKLPAIRDDIVICPTFANFRFDGNCCLPEISTADGLCEEYNYEPPLENESVLDDVNPIDEDLNNVECHKELSTEAEYFSKIITSAEFVTDISHLITSEKSDYVYFNSQMLTKNWNMRHWNPFKIKTKRQVEPRESKRPKPDSNQVIDFQDHRDFDVYNVVATTITINTLPSREKFMITPVTHFNLKEFFRLNVWRKMYIVPNIKGSTKNEDPPSDLEDTINDYNYNNPNDSQHAVPELHEDDYRDDNDSGATTDVHDAMEKCAFMGDNLIDIPNKVSKIQLPYMVKDKSVNMKNLKSKIWNRIEEPNRQIIDERDNNAIKFKNLCQVMLKEEKSENEELTIPILFNAILQLANDKNLYLFNPTENDISDFVVEASS